MNLVRMLRAGLPVMLVGCIAAQIVSADVYTWVDAAGGFNISNLTPPAGARVINVTREAEPNAAARDALRDAEVRALAERVPRHPPCRRIKSLHSRPPYSMRRSILQTGWLRSMRRSTKHSTKRSTNRSTPPTRRVTVAIHG